MNEETYCVVYCRIFVVSGFVVCYDNLMSLTAKFQGTSYNIQITDHAHVRMTERQVSTRLLVTIIETGEVKPKPQQANAFWVFTDLAHRTDNFVCVSLVIEAANLVIKTVLINWRPL